MSTQPPGPATPPPSPAPKRKRKNNLFLVLFGGIIGPTLFMLGVIGLYVSPWFVAGTRPALTLNVWMPAGSEAVQFQAFSQFNDYDGWNAAEPPATIMRDGWTQQKYTLPAISTGGLQLVGIQIYNTGETPFTGDVYVDDVSW